MKFSEIKKKLGANCAWNDCDITVKRYIPIAKKFSMAEQATGKDSDIITKAKSGFATMNRLNYEVNLYYLLVALYTDIEIQDFDDETCDFFIQYEFKKWLNKATNNDAFEFEQMLKNVVLDKLRELNSTSTEMDIEALKVALEELKNINPATLEAMTNLGSVEQEAIRKMVKDEGNARNN